MKHTVTDEICVYNIFHPPTINNNYVVYVNKQIQLDPYTHNLRNLYISLNQADLHLKNWFTEFNKHDRYSSVVEKSLDEWGIKLEKRLNLAGVFYVKEIIGEFNKNNINVAEILLSDQPHLIRSFIDLPDDLLKVWRVNMCIPYEHLPVVVDNLVAHISSYEEACAAIERVEILHHAPKEKIVSYPTLILYLDSKALQDQSCADAFLKSMTLFFQRIDHVGEMTHTFADPWNNFANVTQGFKLYKVYLSLLNVLHDVYEENLNFAYLIKNNRERKYVRNLGIQPVGKVLNEII